jgi:hypothetical protein
LDRVNTKRTNMKTFKIELQELPGRVIEVQAYNFQEAFSKVYDQHRKGEIILGQNDLLEVNFKNIYKQRKKDEIYSLCNEIIDYLYKDELKHFEESDEPNDHIFMRLVRLKSLIT